MERRKHDTSDGGSDFQRDGNKSSCLWVDVPATTLKDRSGRVKHGSKPGPVSYLTEKEERELVDFLVQVARLGYGKTKQEVIDVVRETLEKRKAVLQSSVGKGGGLDSRSGIPMSRANSLSQWLMRTSIF